MTPFVKSRMLDQALRVRRHDALIHVFVGKSLLAKGQLDGGFKHLRFAFNHDPEVRKALVNQLANVFPASFLIDELQPDEQGLWDLYYWYVAAKDSINIQILLGNLIERLTGNAEATNSSFSRGQIYFQLAVLHNRVKQPKAALLCLKKAVRCQPDNYRFRKAFAMACYEHKKYEQAIEQINWCQLRQEDRNLADLWVKCRRMQVALHATSSTR